MRICSLVPSATEILCGLGLGEDLVGVSHECDFPPEALHKPRLLRTLVDQEHLSSEAIDRLVRSSLERQESLYEVDEAALRRASPDLVIAQGLCEVCAITPAQTRAVLHRLSPQPKVVSLHAHTLEELFEEIRLIGHATNRNAEAGRLVSGCVRRIEALQERLMGTGRPRVVCLEWLAPLMACGHWVPEMVELAGGTEMLGRAGEPSRVAAWEEVVAAQPECLFMMPCGFSIERTQRELALLTGRPGWDSLPAVRSGRAWLVDGPSYFNRCGPRSVDGIELLAGLLHPDRCAGLVPAGAAQPLP